MQELRSKSILVLNNFDARINKIEIKPACLDTKIIMLSKMYNDKLQKNIKVKLKYLSVGAFDFQINSFENCIGSEAFGLYEITDLKHKKELVEKIFTRRKEVYLLEGQYDYDKNDKDDILNNRHSIKVFYKEINDYHLYIQNMDAGFYIILAKSLVIEKENL